MILFILSENCEFYNWFCRTCFHREDKSQHDDRVNSLQRLIFFTALPDFFVDKILCSN